MRFRHAAIAQRKGQIVAHGHRVIDHRELEHLCNVAPVRWQLGDVVVIEQDFALGWHEQARDNVEQR